MGDGLNHPLVAALVENRLNPKPLPAPDFTLVPTNLAEAYDLQDVLHREIEEAGGGTVCGYKIGCTSKVMQEYLGINSPCAGGVFDKTVFNGKGVFPFKDFAKPGVECEIAVRLGKDINALDAPHSRESVADAVEACMASIEIVDDRYTDFSKFTAETLVIDDFFDAGCVLGQPVEDWRSLDLAALTGRLLVNGEEVSSGVGADILGHPLDALVWLANARASRNMGLKKGAFVTLGSVVKTHWVEAGDTVEIDFGALGRVSAEFPDLPGVVAPANDF